MTDLSPFCTMVTSVNLEAEFWRGHSSIAVNAKSDPRQFRY